MDFLDRLALWISGKVTTKTTDSSSVNEDIKSEVVDDTISSAYTPKSHLNRKVINDNFKGNSTLLEDRDSKRKLSLEDILPFYGSRRTDWGVWAYRNRYGVFITLIAYLSVLFYISFASFKIMSHEIPQGIFITPQEIVELEKKIEQLQTIPDTKNVISDDNSSEDIEDIYDDITPAELEAVEDIEIDVEALLEESEEDFINMSAQNEYYNRRIKEINDSLNNEREMAHHERQQKFSKEDSLRNQFSKKKGNVTVSYNLKGRKALFLEVPAYLCEGGGQVILEITVLRNGKVTNATVKSTVGVTDPYLTETAIWAAKRSYFDSSSSFPARQKGTLTYIFVAQ